MFKNPFSFEGRIRRTEFGISFIIFVIARVIVDVIAAAIIDRPNASDQSGVVVLGLIFSIPFLWFLWAQGAKRCHDVGNSGWWQLIPFYVFWLIFEDGQSGPNQYGENPKGIGTVGGSPSTGGNNTGASGGYQGGYSGGHNNSGTSTSYSSSGNSSTSGGYKDGDLYK